MVLGNNGNPVLPPLSFPGHPLGAPQLNSWNPQVPSPRGAAGAKALNTCPDGCKDTTMLIGVPPPQPIRPDMPTAFSRCVRCLTYWEVTLQDSKVVNIRWGYDSKTRELGKLHKPGS